MVSPRPKPFESLTLSFWKSSESCSSAIEWVDTIEDSPMCSAEWFAQCWLGIEVVYILVTGDNAAQQPPWRSSSICQVAFCIDYVSI